MDEKSEKVNNEIRLAFDTLRQMMNNKELTFSKLNVIGANLQCEVNKLIMD